MASRTSAPPSHDLWYLIAAGFLWGTGGITGRALADSSGLTAIAVAAYRLGLGGLLVIVWLRVRRVALPRGAQPLRRIAAVAALAALFQCAYFGAVAAGTVSLATLVAIGSSPVFVLLIESVRDRVWPKRAQMLVVVLALVGLVLLVGVPAGSTSLSTSLTCAGLAAVSGVTFAVFTLLGRQPLVGITETEVTGYGFFLGGLVLMVLAIPLTGVGFSATAQNLGLAALLAFAPTALAYVLFFTGLRSVHAGTATVIALLEPLTGTVLSVIFLGDRLSALGVCGALLLAASIVASARAHIEVPLGG